MRDQLKPANVNSKILQNIHVALWDGNTVLASYISKNKAFQVTMNYIQLASL